MRRAISTALIVSTITLTSASAAFAAEEPRWGLRGWAENVGEVVRSIETGIGNVVPFLAPRDQSEVVTRDSAPALSPLTSQKSSQQAAPSNGRDYGAGVTFGF